MMEVLISTALLIVVGVLQSQRLSSFSIFCNKKLLSGFLKNYSLFLTH
ncbi:MAG: hypothetical protein LBP59_02755 [Planctomycetaceae bacterium]|nr:hypothetical protein [Planctomycetaceae bacterium]